MDPGGVEMFRTLKVAFSVPGQSISHPPVVNAADRLGLTAFMAVMLHVLVILGVSFAPQERERREQRSLDVLLVHRPSPTPPEEAQFVAEAHQQGPSDPPEAPPAPPADSMGAVRATLEARTTPSQPGPSAPTPAGEKTDSDSLPLPPAAPLAQKLVPREHRILDQPAGPAMEAPLREESTPSLAMGSATVEDMTEPRPDVSTGADSRARIMEDLKAKIDQRLKAFEARPKRKWITARTREHAYAAYMEAWREKVERIGNLNYPQEARRLGLSGSLSLDVALNADGTVADILLRRSSGENVLDEAAVRIVELAAPFDEFPPSIRAEIDILHIERTWQFSSGNRFNSR